MQEIKEHREILRTVGRHTSGRSVGHAASGRGRKGEKKTPSFLLPGNDFLKETFRGIPLESEEADMISFVEEESRDYLFLCFGNYLSLMGKSFDTPKTDNYRADINRAYDEFASKMNRRVGVNLDMSQPDGMLSVTLYYTHEAFDSAFGWLPISAIYRMPEDMADAFTHFVSYVANSQGIYFPEQHPDFEWILGEELEMRKDEDIEDFTLFIDVANDYNHGYIKEALDRIKGTYTAPSVIIEKCNSLLPLCTGKNKELLDIMVKGVGILKKDSIMSFNYDPDYTDSRVYPDYDGVPPIDVERLFCIVWDRRDDIVTYADECINQELYNTYCPGFVQYMALEPDAKELFRPSPYPGILENWFYSLIDILEEYGKGK
jgi:hypothetical protein